LSCHILKIFESGKRELVALNRCILTRAIPLPLRNLFKNRV
jgi:hypothetical protein